MALGFGYNSWVGIGDESTFGTAVSPTVFCEFNDESMACQKNYVHKPSLRSVSQIRKVTGKTSVSGDIKMQIGYTGFEKLFKHALGSSSVSGSGTYTHAISLADALPTGITLHMNRDAANIGTAYQYSGCKVSKVTFTQSVEEPLMATFSFIGQDESTVSVATPTFPTFTPCSWTDLVVTINSVTTHKVRSFELTLDNSQVTDRYMLGSALVQGFGRSSQRKITVKLQAEYDAQTIKNLYINRTKTPMTFVYNNGGNGLSLSTPAIYLTKAPGTVSSSGPMLIDIEGEAYINSSANDEMTMSNVNSTAGPD